MLDLMCCALCWALCAVPYAGPYVLYLAVPYAVPNAGPAMGWEFLCQILAILGNPLALISPEWMVYYW